MIGVYEASGVLGRQLLGQLSTCNQGEDPRTSIYTGAIVCLCRLLCQPCLGQSCSHPLREGTVRLTWKGEIREVYEASVVSWQAGTLLSVAQGEDPRTSALAPGDAPRRERTRVPQSV